MTDLYTFVLLKQTYIDPRGNAYYPKQYIYGELPEKIRDNPEYISLIENVTVTTTVLKSNVNSDLQISSVDNKLDTFVPKITKVEYKDETQPLLEKPVIIKEPELINIEVKEISSPVPTTRSKKLRPLQDVVNEVSAPIAKD